MGGGGVCFPIYFMNLYVSTNVAYHNLVSALWESNIVEVLGLEFTEKPRIFQMHIVNLFKNYCCF